MKDIRKQILEIIDRIGTYSDQDDPASIYTEDYANKDIESLIKENYVEKAFVEWTSTEDVWHCEPNVWNVAFNEDDKDRLMSTDELRDYWLKKIKK